MLCTSQAFMILLTGCTAIQHLSASAYLLITHCHIIHWHIEMQTMARPAVHWGLVMQTMARPAVHQLHGALNCRAYVRPLSSTRMGRRPCSSASMSDGLHEWKAPLQMNRMWSVLTLPYLVETTDPSMMGSKSLWTPSELASAPPERHLE